MWNKDFLRKLVQTVSKNYGMALADSINTDTLMNPNSVSLGNLASATANTYKDLKEHINDCDEARYYLYVKTFLETAEIDQEQFNQFMEENPNNVKFGLESLKLLEGITLEEQAKMVSKNLSLRASKEIEDAEYYENIFIIMRMDKYLIDLFKKYISWKQPETQMSSAIDVRGGQVKIHPSLYNEEPFFNYPPMDFVTFGFLIKEKTGGLVGNAPTRKGHYSFTEKARKFYIRFLQEEPINKDNNVSNTTSFNYRCF